VRCIAGLIHRKSDIARRLSGVGGVNTLALQRPMHMIVTVGMEQFPGQENGTFECGEYEYCIRHEWHYLYNLLRDELRNEPRG
jgi:hypothetical protein